jgi:hypothetical protein
MIAADTTDSKANVRVEMSWCPGEYSVREVDRTSLREKRVLSGWMTPTTWGWWSKPCRRFGRQHRRGLRYDIEKCRGCKLLGQAGVDLLSYI